jgi:hypothetical protein
MWEYGTYTKDHYLEKRRKENEIRRAEKIDQIPLIPEEIAIPKIHFEAIYGEEKEYNEEIILSSKVFLYFNKRLGNIWLEHQKKERIAFHLNGDPIKYDSKGEIE